MPHDRLIRDVEARRRNAEPWEPLPGMTKLRCTVCHYWHASRDPTAELCADCEIEHQRELRLERERE